MKNELRASSLVAPEEHKQRFIAASEKAETIFLSEGPFEDRRDEMLAMLKELARELVRD